MSKDIKEKKEFPQFSPAAYFGGNFVLGGLSYILLRQYKRFFIFLALMIVGAFIPFAQVVILIGSAFDAYSISKKLKEKTIPEPEYNNALTWVAIGIWLIGVIILIAMIVLLGMFTAGAFSL